MDVLTYGLLNKKVEEAKNVSGEKITAAVNTYLDENPPVTGATAEQAAQIDKNVADIGKLKGDIRILIESLTARLNALADSDDTTLDQMSEVVAYIKSNKSLIDAITTSKINVSDIIDNLTTNVANKPLSASQGVKLKELIDAIAVPTKLSELENDSGYAKTTDIPDKLPNPQKLTFAGAVTAEYDGSGAVTVTIPEGSGGTIDEWKILVPTDNGMKPINTLTNERSIREKAIQLNADGTKAHNLAMVLLSGTYFFATWIEYTSVDYANGGSQCFERWAVLQVSNKVISGIDNWTASDNTFTVNVISSGTLFDAEVISNGTITDASDATIFRISDTKLAVMAEVACGSTARYACTATIEFDSSYNPTITYNEPTINGEFWDMKVIDPTWNSFYQFNNEPSLVSSTYYLPIVVNYKGVQVLSTTDGIAFTTAYFVECEHAYLEVSLTKTSASKFFMAIRSHYSDGALYLVTGTVADGVTTIVDKRRILGVGSARPHIMKCNSKNSGGTVINMPFYVFCCDAERKNGHLYKVRTYDSYGSGKIIEAVDVSTWNNICCYPTHIDFTGTGNISGETPVRKQLFGGTDTSKNNVYVFPIAILDKYQNYAYRDGVDILVPNSNDYVLPVATSETLGGIIAENATEKDTVPVHIKEDGSLAVPTYPEASGSSGEGSGGWELIQDTTLTEDLSIIEFSDLDCYDLRIGIYGRFNDTEDTLSNANANASILVNEAGGGYQYTGHIGYIRSSGSFATIIEVRSALIAPIMDVRILSKSGTSTYKASDTALLNNSQGMWTTEKINYIQIIPSNSVLKTGARIVAMKRN